jgi:hypothetical protein
MDVEIAAPNLRQAVGSNLQELLAQAHIVTGSMQTSLIASIEDDAVVLRGEFIVSGISGPFDHFSIEIHFPDGYPDTEPKVFETGGRIARIADRHIYESSGRCCTCVWEEWLSRNSAPTLFDFLCGPVNDFLVSQCYFEAHGTWPYGDRSHGNLGVFEAACDLLGIEPNVEVSLRMLMYLAGDHLKGHMPCPCGNGKRFRDCHRNSLNETAKRITPKLARRLLLRMRPT